MNTVDIVIEAPLRGEWAILNPPGHPRLAFDFLATKGRKLPYSATAFLRHMLASIPVDATYAWKQPAFAPCDGEVIAVSDGAPDRERISLVRDLFKLLVYRPEPGSPFPAYGGNYIVLKCGNFYPLLAHLKCGSVRVKSGDRVRTGDLLGEVGNSGSSIQPHLHFQVMSSANPFPLFENLLPFMLRQVQKRVGRRWTKASNLEPRKGDHLRL